MMRAGLTLLLSAQADLKVVGEAANREDAFEVVRREQPDILVVDLHLGEEHAADFLEELLGICKARAIIVTGSSDENEMHRAIRAGAVGLVYKEEDPEVLVRAIRKVHGGEAWFSRSLMMSTLSRLRSENSSEGESDPEASKIAGLTAREREIVALAASGCDRRKMARTLHLSESTVRNHLTSIFGKLGVPNQLALVLYAQQHGLDKPTRDR